MPDVVRPGLRVLFCGINPGVRSGQLGQHFARPGNRFWKVLFGAGFTDRLVGPADQRVLLDYGVGITNLVERTSRAASDLTASELRDGAASLERRVAVLAPAWVAVLGVQAYRVAFRRPAARIGRQPERIGEDSGLWLLPNPSGLQARYQLDDMIRLYGELRAAAGTVGS
ncbi:MAG TPA: G/U mismatch-specific DNA glycosylase [Acidimicrobiales bacterium]|nr:G/U mismatch-specific DNA glycosylase [Acidimicrobiales bacterium]